MSRRGWPHRHPPNTPFRLNAQSEQARGLVAWWPGLASAGANLLRDLSSYRRTDGTFGGTPVWAADGERGRVLDFGASDLVDVGDIAELDGVTVLTLSAWMKRRTSSDRVALSKTSNSTSNRVQIGLSITSTAQFFVASGGNAFGEASSISGADWFHLVMVFDGGQATNATRLLGYVNGVVQTLSFTGTIPATTASHTQNLEIGSIDTGTPIFSEGWIDDVRIYSRVLQPQEVLDLYRPATRWELYEPVTRLWVVGKPPAAGGAVTLIVQDALHGHSSDNLGLTQHQALAVNDAAHGHTADSVALTQHHALVVADATHGHAADGVALTQHHVLAVADAAHTQTVDHVALTQHHALAPSDTLHVHTAQNIDLEIAGQVAVEDAGHAHTADTLTLTQHQVLTVADALHGHGVDSLDFGMAAPYWLLADVEMRFVALGDVEMRFLALADVEA